ncbi:MAG: beta-lactamase family protein [Chitinophagaceae bacterium]|nr:beta-lactamase family protein [Chitinophagaceae bacterium]
MPISQKLLVFGFIILNVSISSCVKRETDQAVLACNDNYGWMDSSATHPKNAVYTQLIENLTNIGLPGISLMIEDQQGIWYKSSGFADIGHNTPMQSCHLGKIASATKLFTAVMIYKLVDLGKIKLDDPISLYVDADLLKKIKNSEQVKIKDLLAHSSGIYDIVFDSEFILYTFNNLDKEKSYEKLLSFAFNKEAAFAYNTKQDYNQTLNHVLLAMIVNSVTGQDQSIYLRNEILNPLHLTNTFIRPQENIPWTQVAKGYYDYRKEGILQDLTPLYTGDGKGFTGIYSNPNDLRLFGNALFREKTLISAAMYNSMTHLDNIDTTLGCAGGCRAKLVNINGQQVRWYGHPGGEVNYASGVFYSPDKKATISYIVNYGVAFSELGAYTQAYYDFRQKLFEEVSR